MRWNMLAIVKMPSHEFAARSSASCIAAALALGLSLAPLSTARASDHSAVGDWTTIDDTTGAARSVVRISEEHGRLRGEIVRLITGPNDDPNPLCHDCEGERENQPIVGMTILWDLVREGDAWSGGRILDPENGWTYRCMMQLMEGGRALDVRGYLGIPLFGRSQRWIRAE